MFFDHKSKYLKILKNHIISYVEYDSKNKLDSEISIENKSYVNFKNSFSFE